MARKDHQSVDLDDAKAVPDHQSERRRDARAERRIAIHGGQPAVRVLHGASIQEILVGGQRRMMSYGQLPPSRGDTWEVDFDVEPGAYELSIAGGGNAHHGIASLTVDDQFIGEIDQYMVSDTHPLVSSIYWEGVSEASRHVLRLAVNNQNPESLNYWLCVHEIVLRPVAIRRPLVLTLQVTESDAIMEAKGLTMSGRVVVEFAGAANTTISEVRSTFATDLNGDISPLVAHELSLVSEDGRLLPPEVDDMTLAEFTAA